MSVIIGKISDKDKKIELAIEIHCTNCGKKVPSGICRDKKRVTKLKS